MGFQAEGADHCADPIPGLPEVDSGPVGRVMTLEVSMTRSNPVFWLARHARRGVIDLPRNIVWAFDTTLKDPATSAGKTLQSVGQQAASAVAEVSPFADGADSRLHRVDAALERARQLEAQAREEAENAKERAEAAGKVEADGEKQIEAARDEGERKVAEVVAEAQREADEYVAAKRARAQEIAGDDVSAVEADIATQVERAKDEARKAHAKAEQAIERARDQMRQARELAEAGAEAARRAADEARARAERLSDQADAQAAAARRKVDEANERRKAVASEGRKLGTDAETGPLDLDDMTKGELRALGEEMDLDLKSGMRKQDMVKTIRRSRS
jgi:chromosome segregation ATPase